MKNYLTILVASSATVLVAYALVSAIESTKADFELNRELKRHDASK